MKKGQITFVNLIMIVVTLIIAFALLPTINEQINNTSTDLQNNSNTGTDLTISIMNLIPFFIVLVILVSAFQIAIPKREGLG